MGALFVSGSGKLTVYTRFPSYFEKDTMLQAIRDRITGLVAIFVLGLLAVPFLFFGVDGYLTAVPQNAVAIVGDDEITSPEFETSFAQFRANLRQRQGDAFDEIATNQPLVRREHLEGMIDQLLLRQYAESLGLTVSDSAVLRVLADIPNFQVNGVFDPEVYQQVIRATGRTVRGFERELREDLMVSMIPMALSTSAVVTETEIDRMIALRQETRRLSWLTVSADDFRDQVVVSEDDIEAYYQANLDQFQTEEQVRLAFIDLDAANMRDGIYLSEEELRDRYEAARQRYITPEARLASHILLSNRPDRSIDEARIQLLELAERFEAGESFAELAQTYSDDTVSAEMGGSLGFVEPGQMVEPFEDALFALNEPGQLSDVVESRFGLHLILLEDIRPPEGMSFEEARDEILAEYIERESEGRFIEASDRLVDLIFADDSSLEPLAFEFALSVEETEAFGRSGGPGIARFARVINAAFADEQLLDRRVSDPIELDRNRSVVIQVIEHIPAEARPLEDVREQISQRLIREGARELAAARADELLATLSGGDADLETLAEQEGLSLQQVDALARFDFQHGFDFLNQVFRLPAPEGGSTLHKIPSGDDFAVARLDAVIAGDPAVSSEAERRGIRQQLAFSQMDAEIAALVQYLRANTEIRVLEDRL